MFPEDSLSRGRGRAARQGRRAGRRRGVAAAGAPRGGARRPRRDPRLRRDRLGAVGAGAGRLRRGPQGGRRSDRGRVLGKRRRRAVLADHRTADPEGPDDLRLRDRGGRAEVHLLLAREPLVRAGARLPAGRRARARLPRVRRGLLARDRGAGQRVLPVRRHRPHHPQSPVLRPGSGAGARRVLPSQGGRGRRAPRIAPRRAPRARDPRRRRDHDRLPRRTRGRS